MAEIGQQIGPYSLDRWISSDRSTSCYFATRPEGIRNLHDAAIRIANHSSEAVSALIIDEWETLCRLNHPSIPEPIGQYSNPLAIATRWISGCSLQDVLDAQADELLVLSPKTAIDIVVELSHILLYLHAQPKPVVFGRLAPEHILINHQGYLHLTGVGRPHQKNQYAYSSPEQAAEAFVDWRSDQWALCSILMELLLGEKLYSGRTDQHHSAENGDVQHWISRTVCSHPQFTAVLNKGMETAAGSRYQSERVFISALTEAFDQTGGDSTRRQLVENILDIREQQEQTEKLAPRIGQLVHPSLLTTPGRITPVAKSPEPVYLNYDNELSESIEPDIEESVLDFTDKLPLFQEQTHDPTIHNIEQNLIIDGIPLAGMEHGEEYISENASEDSLPSAPAIKPLFSDEDSFQTIENEDKDESASDTSETVRSHRKKLKTSSIQSITLIMCVVSICLWLVGLILI